MSGYHDPRGDRYAPPPRQRESSVSSTSRPPPSGPSRSFTGPSPSTGPRYSSSTTYRPPYDSAPRGPRYQDSGPPSRTYDPPPPRRSSLSLWSTQNPGGRDGYHHSGQPSSQARSYTPSTYRDHDRDGYDRDYRGPPRGESRYRDGPSRDSYQPPSGPRESYRDQHRITPSSYHPNYSTSPSPPTGPRHGYSSYQPPRSSQPESRSRERTPSGPAGWSSRSSTADRRFYEPPSRPRDHSPAALSVVSSKPRSPPYPPRRDDHRRPTPPRRDSLEREEHPVSHKASAESLRAKEESRPPSPEPTGEVEPEEPAAEEEALTQDDVDRRIRAIEEEMASTELRIEQIDTEKQEHERQMRILKEKMHIPVINEIKGEETEEEIETPIDEKSPVPTKRDIKLPLAKKRPRPVSELEIEEEEDNRENIRVRIWRSLQQSSSIKTEEIEKFPLTTATTTSTHLNIIEKVEDLPDHAESIAQHNASRHAIFRTLLIRQKRQEHRQEKLRRKYRQRYIQWQAHMDKLDSQRQQEMEKLGLGPPKPTEAPLTPRTETLPPGTPGQELANPDPLIRGTRRAQQAAHARDYVQSEAEFLELMQSLGTEEKDPTASIPPMLPPQERNQLDFEDNGLIADPVDFYTRALNTVDEGVWTDMNGWSDEEDRVFLRRLAIAGKHFEKFRKAPQLQRRSVQELVQHYYFLKGDGDGIDWRSIMAGKNRYGKALGRTSAPSALIGSGAPAGRPRAGRGRGRARSGPSVPLLQRDEDDGMRSAADDDADDSGSISHIRRAKKGKIIELTAAKQRPKRSTGPALLGKERNLQPMPSPVPSHLDTDGPPSRERSLLPNAFLPPFSQLDVATSTDRDSSVPPIGPEGKKRAVKTAQTSSYWRVNEMEMFPKHLHTHGKNWRKIAEEMGTKTAQQVKNYYAKNAVSLGFTKIADDAENGSRPPTLTSAPVKVEGQAETPKMENIPVPTVLQPLLEPIAPTSESTYQQLPPPPPQPKALPTVASLLNSPVEEIVHHDELLLERQMLRERLRREEEEKQRLADSLTSQSFWPAPTEQDSLRERRRRHEEEWRRLEESLATQSWWTDHVPRPPPSTLNVPLDMDERRIASPSNASEMSRSQSRGDYYQRGEVSRQSSQLYNSQPPPALSDERYYRDSQSIPPPRYMPSPRQTVLPPVRIHEPNSQQSPYYQNHPSPYNTRMPPPPNITGEGPGYLHEYTRNTTQQRLPSIPPQIPGTDPRPLYLREEADRHRYPPLPHPGEESFFDRSERAYYADEARYLRDRIEKGFHLETDRRLETERLETERRMETERQPVERGRGRARERSKPTRLGWTQHYEREQAAKRERELAEQLRERLRYEAWLYGYDQPGWRESLGRARTPPSERRSMDRGGFNPERGEFNTLGAYERERLDRLERDRLERDRTETERDRFDRERWTRR